MHVELNYGKGKLPVELRDDWDVRVIGKKAMPILANPTTAVRRVCRFRQSGANDALLVHEKQRQISTWRERHMEVGNVRRVGTRYRQGVRRGSAPGHRLGRPADDRRMAFRTVSG